MGYSALGHAVVFRMLGKNHVVCLGVFDSAAHELRVVDALAIVGKHAHTAAGHQTDLGERLALESLGNRAHRVDIAFTVRLALLPDRLGEERLVDHWVGIRHGEYSGEASLGGSIRAGSDGFGVLAARLTQVHVHIDETRKQYVATTVDGFISIVKRVVPNGVDDTVFHVNENAGHVLAIWTNVVECKLGHLIAPSSPPVPASSVNNTAMRVYTPLETWPRTTALSRSATS